MLLYSFKFVTWRVVTLKNYNSINVLHLLRDWQKHEISKSQIEAYITGGMDNLCCHQLYWKFMFVLNIVNQLFLCTYITVYIIVVWKTEACLMFLYLILSNASLNLLNLIIVHWLLSRNYSLHSTVFRILNFIFLTALLAFYSVAIVKKNN